MRIENRSVDYGEYARAYDVFADAGHLLGLVFKRRYGWTARTVSGIPSRRSYKTRREAIDALLWMTG